MAANSEQYGDPLTLPTTPKAATHRPPSPISPGAWAKKVQGRRFSIEELYSFPIEELLQNQIEYGQGALRVIDMWQGREDSTEAFENIKIAYLHYHYTQLGNNCVDPQKFAALQSDMYQLIYESQLSDTEITGFELMMGLTRFMIASQIITKFAQYLTTQGIVIFPEGILENAMLTVDQLYDEEEDPNRFFTELRKAFEVIYSLQSIYLTILNHENYWLQFHQFLETDEAICAIAKGLVSLAYEPNPHFTTAEQTLHWQGGFGFDGNWIKDYPELAPLMPLLLQFFDGTAQKSLSHGEILLTTMITPLRSFSNAVICAFLSQTAPDSSIYKLYDLGSGGTYGAIKQSVDSLVAEDKQVILHLSDIDARSLTTARKLAMQYKTEEGPVRINEVQYKDLNYPLQVKTENRFAHDIVSASLVFHQLFPSQQMSALQHCTALAKEHGLISIPKTRDNLQAGIIPTNIIAREGQAFHDRDIVFTHIAVEIPESDLVQIPYPMRHLAFKKPRALVERGHTIVESNFYLAVRMCKAQLVTLDQLWEAGEYDRCDTLVNTAIADQHATGLDILALQESILATLDITTFREAVIGSRKNAATASIE